MDLSTILLLILTLLAGTTRIVAIAATGHLVATIDTSWPTYGLAVVALAFDACALTATVTTAWLSFRRTPYEVALGFWISASTACLTGSILSLVSFGNAIHLWNASEAESGNVEISEAALTVTVMGLFFHVFFFAWIWPSRGKSSFETTERQHERMPSPLQMKPSPSVRLVPLDPIQAPCLSDMPSKVSPTRSHFSISLKNSFRNSVTQVLRPMTSKTRLIISSPLAQPDSQSMNSTSNLTDAIKRSDDFENWDTSGIERAYSPYQSKPCSNRLTPIPGSRSVSPARPLDGPFPDAVEEAEESAEPYSPLSQQSTLSLPVTISPMEEPPYTSHIARSRTQGTAFTQSHIHPLFRSESPVPPPVRSPNTVITASPFAGQVFIHEQALASPRLPYSPLGSRPSSPSMFRPDLDRPSSSRGYRTAAALPRPPLLERSVPNMSNTSVYSSDL